MSTQSPPSMWKANSNNAPQGPSGSPRQDSPSPSFRERQRQSRGHSVSYQSPLGGQTSPTGSISSFHTKRSPPPQAPVAATRRPLSPTYPSSPRAGSPVHLTPPPPPVHSMSQPSVHQHPLMPPPPQHSLSQGTVHPYMNPQLTPMLGYPRPVPRAAAPQFLSMESFQMTPELIEEIDQAHRLGASGSAGLAYAGGAVSGTAGVAYAGGASSGAISKSHFESASPPKESVVDRLRGGERVSPRESDGNRVVPALQRRDTMTRDKDRQWDGERDLGRRGSIKREHAAQLSIGPSTTPPPPRNESPTYHTPLGTPGENSAAYTQYEREPYPVQLPARSASPAEIRKTSNPSYTEPASRGQPGKTSGHTPPNLSAKARTPDRSLPVQEEPEEDIGIDDDEQSHRDTDRWVSASEGNSSRYDHRHERRDNQSAGQEVDLSNDGSADDRQGEASRSQDEESYTPRSPVANLPPERSYAGSRGSPIRQQQPQPPRVKNRNGSTDQLGLRTFDPAVFEDAVEKLKLPNSQSQDTNQHHQYGHASQASHSIGRSQSVGQYDDVEHFLDDPAGSYYQNYLPSPQSTHSHTRPGAPVPPTPHSQTAAPSPSPLISGMHRINGNKPVLPPYSPAPPVGSPYPYPYGHIRRGQTYAGSQNGTNYSQFDPNVVREQLALQMQIYAMNNGGMVSDSTLSPSSTPFPGPNYNPWTFLQAGGVFGGGHSREDATMSMRSSPSHEPVHLPIPSIRRGLRRRERSMNLGGPGPSRQNIKPPPRVESTQPRETSPEMSSGEETAGESKVEEHYPSETPWRAVDGEDEGEWVDEDGIEGDEDDLLQLEYHTDFISNPEKRRRRWNTRWEALLHAFHAIDRETDTTLVLLAAPAHSSKLHSVASRSLRRDSALFESHEMVNMRSSFGRLAAKRRAARSQVSSLIERLSMASASSRDGSPSSAGESKEDLRRALETAIGSLSALGNIYTQRETRWLEEMRRVNSDREKVQLLLQQVLGVGFSEEPNAAAA